MFFEDKSKILKADARMEMGLSKDDKVVLFFGHILRYKGLEYLLKAFKKVVKEVPTAKLIIAGEPREDFSPYKHLISKLGIKKHLFMDLEYLPFEKVARYFSAGDVITLPYIKTYQSAVLQLAYAFGKPVIVTRTGGLPEVVEEGRSGYIIPTEDANGLAKTLVEVLSDEDKLLEMGEYAQMLAETKYSWKNITRMTLSVYQGLLDSRKPLKHP
jgi:glycosyltransferase involved in cell wall biosynthesis